MPNNIWDNLKAAIEKEIPKDPVAVKQVFEDVEGFPAWLFEPGDEYNRPEFAQIPDTLPKRLVDAVQPTVVDNLKAMQEVDELPAGTDINTMIIPTTYKLVGYILSWEKWLPARREEEAMTLFENLEDLTNDIYYDDSYGDITNIPDNSLFDDFDDKADTTIDVLLAHGTHDQRAHGHRGASPYDDKADDPEAERKIANTVRTATQKRQLAGGRSGASVDFVKGPNGRAVVKGGLDPDVVDREYLSAKVGKALGAPVPRIAKIDSNTIAGEYVQGRIAGTFDRDIGRLVPFNKDAERSVRDLKGARELAMMDIATRNHDRHGGNIMVRPDGKSIVGIDHTVTFGAKAYLHKILPPSTALQLRWKPTFTKKDYQDAARKLAPLQKDFLNAGRLEWHNDMMRRMNELGAE